MVNIVFFVRHFFERGTEVAIYDYAHYNETILGNKSYIACFAPEKQLEVFGPDCMSRVSYARFKDRFQIFELSDFSDIKGIITEQKIDYFYTLVGGWHEAFYRFNDTDFWGACKTVKHCVFTPNCREGSIYACISDYVNSMSSGQYPVIPHMVHLPDCEDDLRAHLGIDKNALVLGRHGGLKQFDHPDAQAAVARALDLIPDVYFLFMNTENFIQHPRVIYLPITTNLVEKRKFINTCDAMLHGRSDGETFGLSVAEFSVCNKPVLTSRSGCHAHLDYLGDRAILYYDTESLIHAIQNLRGTIQSRSDWNAYKLFSPEEVMAIFARVLNI